MEFLSWKAFKKITAFWCISSFQLSSTLTCFSSTWPNHAHFRPKTPSKRKKTIEKKQTHNFFAYERKRNCLTAIFTLRCTNGNFLFRKWINAGITLGNVFDGDFFPWSLYAFAMQMRSIATHIFNIFADGAGGLQGTWKCSLPGV